MEQTPGRSNAEVLDILFAVAIGEGTIWGVQEYRDLLVSGELFSVPDAAQGFVRVLLGFLLIILSWLHFRRSTLSRHDYPAHEFVFDILVAVSYMVLFLFVAAPTAFYVVITLIWLLYLGARYLGWRRRLSYLAFGLAFIVYFALIAISGSYFSGDGFEWTRLVLVATGIIVYRPLDQMLDPSSPGHRTTG